MTKLYTFNAHVKFRVGLGMIIFVKNYVKVKHTSWCACWRKENHFCVCVRVCSPHNKLAALFVVVAMNIDIFKQY